MDGLARTGKKNLSKKILRCDLVFKWTMWHDNSVSKFFFLVKKDESSLRERERKRKKIRKVDGQFREKMHVCPLII